MACAGCGVDVAPGSRWCDECVAMWKSRDAGVTSAPPAPPSTPNVNIGVQPVVGVGHDDLHGVLAGMKEQYTRAGITILNTAFVPMAGHQVLQLTVTNPTLTRFGHVTVVQDFVAANDLMYIVTFTGTNPNFKVIAATFSVS